MPRKMNNVNTNTNAKGTIKKIVVYAGAGAILVGGTIALGSCICNGCVGKEPVNTSSSYDSLNSVNSSSSGSFVSSSSSTSSVMSDNSSSNDMNSSSSSVSEDNSYDMPELVTDLSVEDITKLSTDLNNHVSEVAILSHENYQYAPLDARTLYTTVYLANIDYISAETTNELIEKGMITDNIHTNIEISQGFYGLYFADTINKILSGNTNIMDLSVMMSNSRDKEVAKTMRKQTTDFVDAPVAENRKNFQDLAAFYSAGEVISQGYDFSKSIYNVNEEQIGVGADYSLYYGAQVIVEAAKYYDQVNEEKITDKQSLKILNNQLFDCANIMNVFNDYCNTLGISSPKTLTK